jgi:hypothetical protein
MTIDKSVPVLPTNGMGARRRRYQGHEIVSFFFILHQASSFSAFNTDSEQSEFGNDTSTTPSIRNRCHKSVLEFDVITFSLRILQLGEVMRHSGSAPALAEKS